MAIPKNITKIHLLQAIDKIEQEGIPDDGDSQYYDVLYNGRRYPPKLVVSYSNLFANGEIIDRKKFPGGINTQCFKLLEENQFQIVPKISVNNMSYFAQLIKFLAQSETDLQGTANYLNSYLGLNVKVSFGKGNLARIPWIAFLGDTNTVQQGIYPVYLYYKERKLLILAYGISETKPPNRNWNVINGESIKDYFSKNNLGVPKRYGSSIVYKVYDVNKELDEELLNNDLDSLIKIYKSTISMTKLDSEYSSPFRYLDFTESALNSGLHFNDAFCLRFTASLLTKPFVILTGLSGSGKTKLAQAFAKWLCESEDQFCIVPVGADWTNREPLLGFPNALKSGEYVNPDNRSLETIIAANSNPTKPYFLILDEMNLSHVERYFADFLSAMESKGKISLHSGDEDWNNVPSDIIFPQNLFIIGTVNIDETTYMFSPKVLDRSSVIEFRVTTSEMETYLKITPPIKLENLERNGADMAINFVEIAKDDSLKAKDIGELKDVLIKFFSELKSIGAEFGYRSASEIVRFAAVVNKIEPSWNTSVILDAAIMQKILPKVHGSRRKLEPVLKMLASLCLKDGAVFEDYLKNRDLSSIKYPVSLEKIIRMYDNLISNGFTSYAEA